MATSRLSSTFFIPFLLCFLLLTPLIVHSSKPTKSLKDLEGCHKGQKVQGIHKLKQYLAKFGYFEDNGSLTNMNDDEFDQFLESAIKKYQTNYHLNVTGALDHDTIKDMMLPSCGNPDIIAVDKHAHSHNRRSKLIHTTSHFAFFSGMPKWPITKNILTYSFRSTASSIISEQALKSASARAFRKWEAVSRFTFQEAPLGTRGDLEIGFHRGAHGDQNPFDGRGNMFGNVFAHAFRPTIGNCHYDADENWSENPTSGSELDLESVVVHEIGHLLGLGHSFVPESIMYRYFNYGLIKRDLHPDDIEGIRVLYS